LSGEFVDQQPDLSLFAERYFKDHVAEEGIKYSHKDNAS
jgi:hypothetical protein